MRFFRYVVFAITLLGTTPAFASPFTVLIGDKDWFGSGAAGKVPGVDLIPFDDTQHFDFRSFGEAHAGDGAQLTDAYSGLYPAIPSECDTDPITGKSYPGCNAPDRGNVVFSLGKQVITAGAITFLRGGFQCSVWGALRADVNGIPIAFCFDDGNDDVNFLRTSLGSIPLTPAMLAAANADGSVILRIFHDVPRDTRDGPGSLDYIAFDYFELNGDITAAPVPEPSTWMLLVTGLAVIGASVRRRLRPIAIKLARR